MEAPLSRNVDTMLCFETILERFSYAYDSPWASPVLAHSKKIAGIRILNDSRKTKLSKGDPSISQGLGSPSKTVECILSATAVDLSQGFYSIPIIRRSQKDLHYYYHTSKGEWCLQEAPINGSSLCPRQILVICTLPQLYINSIL